MVSNADQERVIDYAAVTEAYANVLLTHNGEHVVRMSVMTEPYHWHRHPDSDETFIVIEGIVLLQTSHDRVELRAGQAYTVPAGLAHLTAPLSDRSVNLTVERANTQTERVAPPRPADDIV